MNFSAKLSCAFISVLLLFGCATAPQQEGTEGVMALEPLASSPELPNIELTEEILGDLFVAELATQRGQYGLAVEKYHALALQTRDPRLVERAARIALFAQEYKIALQLSQLWSELAPVNIAARQILTGLQLKLGDYDAALDSFDQVLAQMGGNERDRYLLMIRLLGREPDKEGALIVISRFVERYPGDVSALYAYAQLALRAGKYSEAENSVDQLLAQKKDWPQAVILKTRLFQATQRKAQALTFLSEVVARKRDNLELRMAYGRLLVDVGQTDEALKQFRKILKVEPENDDILFAAGLVALRVEKLDEARTYFNSLFERSVRLNNATYYLGRIAELQDDNEGAIRWYAKVGAGDNYISAQIRHALLLARSGDVASARANLHAVKARRPSQQLRLFLAEGEILRDVGSYDEALDVYNAALIEEPDNGELLYARAMVAERLGNIDILERDLKAVLEREPDHVDALNSLGYTLADRTERYDEAFIYVKRALDLNPDSFYILDSMGWVYFRLGQLDKALNYLQQAMVKSNDPEIAAHLGEVLWVMGDRPAAQDVWHKALELSPDNATVLKVMKRLVP